MDRKTHLIGIVALALAVPATAAPDYIWFTEHARRAAEMANSNKSCQRLGFIVNEEALKKHIDQVVEDGAMSGIPVEWAARTFTEAIEQDRRNLEYLMEQSEASDEARERYLDYWERRCTRLTESVHSAGYFSAQ